MKEEFRLRRATLDDATAIVEIYRPYCRETIITFETEAPQVDEMAARIKEIGSTLPWLVAVADKNTDSDSEPRIGGYAYAARHRARRGYQWSVETSVYLDPEFRGKGLGGFLYKALFQLLEKQGYINAYAGIALPNAASEALHRAFHFEPVGIYKKVGYKMNQWIDVAWWHKQLNDYPYPDPNPDSKASSDWEPPDPIAIDNIEANTSRILEVCHHI